MPVNAHDTDEPLWPSRRESLARNKPLKFGLQAVAAVLAWQACKSIGRALGLLATPPSSRGHAAAAQAALALDEARAAADSNKQVNEASAREQWLPNKQPAPPVPDSYKLAVEADLNVTVYDFYEHFLSNDSTTLQDHYRCTTQDFKDTKWRRDGDGLSRTLTFVQPKQGVQPCDVPCRQQQRLAVYADGVLVFSSSQEQFASPYCDCYNVCCFWKVQPDATGTGCKVSIYVGVVFSRSPMVRALITRTAFTASKAFFTNYLDKVKSHIDTEMLATTVSLALNSSGADPNPQLLRRLANAAHTQQQLLERQPSSTPGAQWGQPLAKGQSGTAAAGAGLSGRLASKPSFSLRRSGGLQGSGGLAPVAEGGTKTRAAVLPTALLLMVLVLQLLLVLDHVQLRRQVLEACSVPGTGLH